MPVKIPRRLPARKTLESEGIFVIPEDRAFHQDIRPLQVAIVNIMPLKSETETRLLRLLSNSPLQLDVTLLHLSSHKSKNTPEDYLKSFYATFDEVRARRFDGLIITGAPVESLPFARVNYWSELQEVMEWSKSHVHSTLHICWGAQAGMFHHYGVEKHALPSKLTGVFDHRVLVQDTSLLRGFDDTFLAPHSRYTETRYEELSSIPGLEVLSISDRAGVYIVSARKGRHLFITGHPEYDIDTLRQEYERDTAKGLNVTVPEGYFPDDDPSASPIARWRGHASLLFSNWLNKVYQEIPFNLEDLESIE